MITFSFLKLTFDRLNKINRKTIIRKEKMAQKV